MIFIPLMIFNKRIEIKDIYLFFMENVMFRPPLLVGPQTVHTHSRSVDPPLSNGRCIQGRALYGLPKAPENIC